ncbi:MAG TPA: ATP-binding protein [Ktedonobacteraceae bacterium]|nr:ATP-binding protein [Ktedonobacteraceae bacterium]
MSYTTLAAQKYHLRGSLSRRWTMVIVGLLVQLFVLVAVLSGINQPQTPDVSLTPVAGHPGLCRVVAVRPFSESWIHGIQVGMQVRVRVADSGQAGNCTVTTQHIQLEVVGFPAHPISVDIQSSSTDFIWIATNLLLALIFSVTGIAIYLRAQNRPTARVTYALFYCIALTLCLFNSHSTSVLWINLLAFLLSLLIRGLAATFVCLFPYASQARNVHKKVRLLPYLPLLVGVILALVSLPMPLAAPPLGLAFTIISFAYSLACILVVISIMAWGLRHLSWQERWFVRMVVIGILFLLLPRILDLNVVDQEKIIQVSLLRLIAIPLAVLPIACNYALFRTQLLGTTSMLSRQAMRILLWVLLASVFVFSAIIGLRFISTLGVSSDTLDYIYAGLLVVSLALFPLVWSKVRDVGDQVFYGDFYRYNQSLRDLSAALTRLQGIEQISAFMLPRLAALLNATETALLLRTLPSPLSSGQQRKEEMLNWRLYRHRETRSAWASRPGEQYSDERLVRVADLALTHLDQRATGPIVLDGMLLLPLYDGNRCSGFLCLGPKFSLEPYSKQDGSFLSTLASQLSVLEVNSRYLEQAQSDAQQLAALYHRVVSAQEEERRHLALELHDEALQQAMLLVRQLSDAGTMEEVAEVMPLARSVEVSLRRTCLQLRPPLLNELGLEEAFHWLARQTEEHSDSPLQIEVHCHGLWEPRPSANVELALYRVGQEALSNISKYAGASRAVIRLRRRLDGTISLLIADNGRGFQPEQRQAESLGLVGMHERMVAIGGTLQLRSRPGRGVIIRAISSSEKSSAPVSLYDVLQQQKMPYPFTREAVLS